jgi:hypothetical protein
MSDRGRLRLSAFARLIIVSCLLPLAACGFQAPAPRRTPPPAAPAPPVSTVSATLVLPLADVLTFLNARTQNQIADIRDQPFACVITNCSLDLLATRTGDISGSASGDALFLTVPLAVTAHMAVKGGFFRTSAQGQAQGIAEATTNLQLASDWRLVPHSHGTIRLNKGELKLGPVKMNIADLWNHNASHLSDMLFRALDREIAGHVRIKAGVEGLWAKLATPMRIGKKPETWLLLTPQRIFLAQPVTRNDALVLALSLTVEGQVMIGNPPPQNVPIAPLPPPAALATPSDRFTLSVPVILPYGTAEQLAMRRLANRPLRVAGMPIRITSLAILPSGHDVIVAARFCVRQTWDVFGWFDSCGGGYLRGVPQYDSRTQMIHIANLHYDIGTANVLLVAMKSLGGDALV